MSAAEPQRPPLRSEPRDRPLHLAPSTPEPTETAARLSDGRTIELKLTFAELVLIEKSLLAARTLRGLGSQDEFLSDTLQIVDMALWQAVGRRA
jgi:hypothetical protein